MRMTTVLTIACVSLGASWAALSFTQAQNQLPAPAPKVDPPQRDLSRYSPLQRQMYLSAQRGADWLYRSNRPDGRFEYGFIPALTTKLEGDHFLRQAGAAYALARAARLTGDERHAAVARQAVLTLLLETDTENIPGTKDSLRRTTLPSVVVNRLASAGLLVLAINELPGPADDLLLQSQQLCAYIVRQQQNDGSLAFGDGPADTQTMASDPDGINTYPGIALYALMRSQQHRPATWKVDVVRKALAYYRPCWQKNKNMAFVPWQSAAYAEAFLATREQPFADAVYEMNDWLCGMQYTSLDPRRPLSVGGFMACVDGKPAPMPPQINSAFYAEGLVEACRTAKQAGELQRYQRYRDSVERCLQFLTTLQYTEGNTQHFADWYRPRLLGGFHASHQDGNLRIDYTQHAVSTLVQYLSYVAD